MSGLIGVGRIGGLMKVRVDAAADDGDGRDTRFFERDVIAAGEKSEEIELLRKTDSLSRFERHVLLESRHTDRQPSISDSRMVDVDHGFGRADRRDRPFEIEPRSDESLFFSAKGDK